MIKDLPNIVEQRSALAESKLRHVAERNKIKNKVEAQVQAGIRAEVACRILDSILSRAQKKIEADENISGFWKGVVLKAFPSSRDYAKKSIREKMSDREIRELLEEIRMELDGI